MDSIVKAFSWGHELRERKLHLLNWDKICQPKSWARLGLKKFNLVNQAILAKQYWRISYSPDSLLARTFKGKYFPRGSIQDCTPKPHQPSSGEVSSCLITPNLEKEDAGLAKVIMFHSHIQIGSKPTRIT